LASAATAALPVPHNKVITPRHLRPAGKTPWCRRGLIPKSRQSGYYNPILPNDSGNANPGGGVGLPS
jgi:hypothetical protein